LAVAGEENKDAIIQLDIIASESHERCKNVFLSRVIVYKVRDIAAGKAKIIKQDLSYLACVADGIREGRRILIVVDSYDQCPAGFVLRLCKESYVFQNSVSPISLCILPPIEPNVQLTNQFIGLIEKI
jgi:hypothetical protein